MCFVACADADLSVDSIGMLSLTCKLPMHPCQSRGEAQKNLALLSSWPSFVCCETWSAGIQHNAFVSLM